MKKHKQHLIDHNTLESTAQKVDSSTAAMDRHATASAVSRDDRETPSLRGSEATEAIHTNADSSVKVDRHATASAVSRDDRETPSLRGSEATEAIHNEKVDSSMDRHADKSARDDGETSQEAKIRESQAVTPTLTPSQQDSRIFALESRALQGERGDKTNGLSHKRAAAITDSSQKAESSPTLCACSEFVYLGSLPYTLRLPTGKTYPLHQGDSFIVPQGDLSRYLEYKSTMFKKLR